MGVDYALVHLKYTIPQCIALTVFYRPLFTRLDLYRITFLITIAVVSTVPWDSYLIRNGIWTYPPDAVLGITVFQIPLEELFFFVIQTYGTCLFYIVLSRPTFKPACLPHEDIQLPRERRVQLPYWIPAYLGRLLFAYCIWKGNQHVQDGGTGTYLGLIMSWSFPFILLLWHISCEFLLRLPVYNIALPIVIPTLYLWIVDTLALRRGTWVIVPGTKLGVHVWEGLDVEEAFFFLVTNCMIVFGSVAFDYCATIIQTYPELAPNTRYPSPIAALRVLLFNTSLLTGQSTYDADRILGLNQAVDRLRRKSRSFYLASSTFEGEVRIDLVTLYSFCRMADDLVDGAPSRKEANLRVKRLQDFLEQTRSDGSEATRRKASMLFPSDKRQALVQLPIERLSRGPLDDLVKGFTTDLKFGGNCDVFSGEWPIKSVTDLMNYGHAVAGTVAELCLDVAFHYHGRDLSEEKKQKLKSAGNTMGKALQTINIARDIQVDAKLGRVYIPADLLAAEGLRPEDVVENSLAPIMGKLRSQLLDIAFDLYDRARPSIEELPIEVRSPMRVAVESYMEIGRVLQDEGYVVQPGKATVGTWRRLMTAIKALNS